MLHALLERRAARAGALLADVKARRAALVAAAARSGAAPGGSGPVRGGRAHRRELAKLDKAVRRLERVRRAADRDRASELGRLGMHLYKSGDSALDVALMGLGGDDAEVKRPGGGGGSGGNGGGGGEAAAAVPLMPVPSSILRAMTEFDDEDPDEVARLRAGNPLQFVRLREALARRARVQARAQQRGSPTTTGNAADEDDDEDGSGARGLRVGLDYYRYDGRVLPLLCRRRDRAARAKDFERAAVVGALALAVRRCGLFVEQPRALTLDPSFSTAYYLDELYTYRNRAALDARYAEASRLTRLARSVSPRVSMA